MNASGSQKNEKKIFYLIGDARAKKSKTPAMFKAVIKRQNINASYILRIIEPDELGKSIRSLKTSNITGANITIPYKEKVIPYMDVLSEGATIIRSINTVVKQNDKLKGYNTNAIGFMDTLKEIGFDAKNKSAIVVGSGGAARAVVFILNWFQAKQIIITDPDEKKTKDISIRIGGQSMPLEAVLDKPVSANIIINATPATTAEEYPGLESLVHRVKVSDCEILMDLNYGRSGKSVWKDVAEEKGLKFMDGQSALINQAKRTFSLWTGIEIDKKIFKEILEKEI